MASLTAPTRKSDTPPPLIGKAGRYTVFIKPPPVGSPSPRAKPSPKPSPKPKNVDVESQGSPAPAQSKPYKMPEILPESFKTKVSDTMTKIQNAYTRVDEVLAYWFGLNQSKYQWALNEYLERKEMETEDGKPRETVAKGQEMQHVIEQVMKREDQPSP